jgi:hypothetical protein
MWRRRRHIFSYVSDKILDNLDISNTLRKRVKALRNTFYASAKYLHKYIKKKI